MEAETLTALTSRSHFAIDVRSLEEEPEAYQVMADCFMRGELDYTTIGEGLEPTDRMLLQLDVLECDKNELKQRANFHAERGALRHQIRMQTVGYLEQILAKKGE